MAKVKWNPAPGCVGWNKVKALRRAQGLSQAQLAVGAGVSMTTVYNVEMGYEDRLTDRVKSGIAKFFDCDVDDLFPCEMIGNEPRTVFLERAKIRAAEK